MIGNDASQYQDKPDRTSTVAKPRGSTGQTSWNGQYSANTYATQPSGIDTDPAGFNGAGGDSSISVDSRALQWYADRIQDLQAPVIEARGRLDAVHLAPGRFKSSQSLQLKVGGDSGVAVSYAQTLQKMLPALADLAGALRELAKNYDTAEELSSDAAMKALGTALDGFDSTSAGTTAG